jgi:hypothetical protein
MFFKKIIALSGCTMCKREHGPPRIPPFPWDNDPHEILTGLT